MVWWMNELRLETEDCNWVKGIVMGKWEDLSSQFWYIVSKSIIPSDRATWVLHHTWLHYVVYLFRRREFQMWLVWTDEWLTNVCVCTQYSITIQSQRCVEGPVLVMVISISASTIEAYPCDGNFIFIYWSRACQLFLVTCSYIIISASNSKHSGFS